MGKLLLLFIVLPAVELWLLIEVGRRIGSVETVGLIVVTGIVGASMARSQGLRVLTHVQKEVASGKMPTDSLVDGIMILLASALLITPGVLTDAFGFLCLVPGFRALVKRELVRRFERAVAENRVHVQYTDLSGGTAFGTGVPGRGPIVDITPGADRNDDEDPSRPV